MHDYTEDDRWDWDRDDPRQYCRHGSFIGSSWGPDILCGMCESMDDDPSLNDMLRDIDSKIKKIQHEFDGMSNFISTYKNKLGYDLKDSAFSEAVLETMERLNQRRELLQKDRKKLIEKYEPFCDNGDWNSKYVLYNYHNYMIYEYNKERKTV